MSVIDPRMAARRAQVAEHRMRRGLLRLLVVLALVGLGAGAVWTLRSPLFSVETIRLVGVGSSSAADLLPRSGVAEGVPLIAVDVGAVEQALLADPWIEAVEVGRRWPRTVVVEVTERFPVAWVQSAEGWVEVAGDGVVLSQGSPEEGDPVVVLAGIAPADLAEDPAALGALEFVATLREDLSRGAVVEGSEVEVTATVAGHEVRLGRPVDMAEKARALAAVLDTEPEPGSVITVVAPSRPAVLSPSATTSTTQPPDDGGEG